MAGIVIVIVVLLSGRTPLYLTRRHLTIHETDFVVEQAVTESQRQRGLMYRSTLAPYRGMLLVFPSDGPWTIWMHNMRFPIDVLWLTSDCTVVDIASAMRPELDEHTGVATARFVLELPAGTVSQRGIIVGDTVGCIINKNK